MNKTLSNLFIFTAGAAIGAVVTWKLVKDKYAQLAREEIAAVREVYRAASLKNKHAEETESENTPEAPQTGIPEFTERERVDYANLASVYAPTTEEGGTVSVKRPYVISPEEFDEVGYDTISLTMYDDGVVEDEFGDVVARDDVDRMVGLDSLNHFGEYEEDSVFVRNDETETDYEILRDPRKYSDVPRRTPVPGYE
ncbi:MAG: hypothetical protein IKZ08_02590 [Bacteroidales bacterium]|nr:hypothetical protein [Bacteroidales bacterium]